ncbi:hypothetical protein VIDI103191_14990 [Vibrio diazotrophicus]
MNKALPLSLLSLVVTMTSFSSIAEEQASEVQDMSDPLAVFTQGGVGITDKGLNLKVGQTYDSGKENVAAMNVFELKGIGDEMLGFEITTNLCMVLLTTALTLSAYATSKQTSKMVKVVS